MFGFGVFIELKDHECGIHGFMVVIQKLVFAVGDNCFKELHAEVIDVVGVVAGLEQFPVLGWRGAVVFENFFGLFDEPFGHKVY